GARLPRRAAATRRRAGTDPERRTKARPTPRRARRARGGCARRRRSPGGRSGVRRTFPPSTLRAPASPRGKAAAPSVFQDLERVGDRLAGVAGFEQGADRAHGPPLAADNLAEILRVDLNFEQDLV